MTDDVSIGESNADYTTGLSIAEQQAPQEIFLSAPSNFYFFRICVP
jgi:hypothetical protein